MSSKLPRMLLASLLATSGCTRIPPACEAMCASATRAQQDCLTRDGLDWDRTVWSDAEDFTARCEVWAWEAEQLERDAWWRGARGQARIDDTCTERDAALTAEPSCETLERLGWDLPWEASDDGA